MTATAAPRTDFTALTETALAKSQGTVQSLLALQESQPGRVSATMKAYADLRRAGIECGPYEQWLKRIVDVGAAMKSKPGNDGAALTAAATLGVQQEKRPTAVSRPRAPGTAPSA